MKKHINEFTIEDKELVIELYNEGYSVKDICILLDLSYYETVYLLQRKIDGFNAHDHLSFTDINDQELLILSDTHIGSRKENFEYIEEAYKKAATKGIKTAIHAGDLIQSTYDPVKPEFADEEKQIEHLINYYPYLSDFTTYVLLGNHDLNTFKKDPKYLQMLQDRKDLVIMGFKRAYLTWLGNLICIYHSCPKYRLTIPNIENLIQLTGHSHKLSINKQGYFYIPSASDDMIQHKTAHPGFIIGGIEDQTLTLDSYRFENGLHEDGPVLTKKIK